MVAAKVNTVKNLYELLDEGKYEQYLSNFTSDALWIEPEGSEFGGYYRGVEEIENLITEAFEHEWSEFEVEISRIVSDGDTVITLTTTRGKYAETGRRMETRAAHVYDFDGDLITRMESFEDTAALNRAIEETS